MPELNPALFEPLTRIENTYRECVGRNAECPEPNAKR